MREYIITERNCLLTITTDPNVADQIVTGWNDRVPASEGMWSRANIFNRRQAIELLGRRKVWRKETMWAYEIIEAMRIDAGGSPEFAGISDGTDSFLYSEMRKANP